MRKHLCLLTAALICALSVYAQDVKMPVNLDKLKQRATNSVDVTLDASLLRFASGFLSKNDADEQKVKALVSKLRGIYVRSFDFDKEGQYSSADVDAIRAQLKPPEWSRMVSVKSTKGENTEIYLKKRGDQVDGLMVLDAEPKELTVVHIDGPFNPEDLSDLSGHLGIPKFGTGKTSGASKDDKI